MAPLLALEDMRENEVAVRTKYPTINQSLLFHNKAGARTLATKKKTQGAIMDPTLSGKIQNTKVRG